MKEALEIIMELSEDKGVPKCTWGDTDFDSESVAFGFNLALDHVKEIAKKALTNPIP